jgi:hypothetical protein
MFGSKQFLVMMVVTHCSYLDSLLQLFFMRACANPHVAVPQHRFRLIRLVLTIDSTIMHGSVIAMIW